MTPVKDYRVHMAVGWGFFILASLFVYIYHDELQRERGERQARDQHELSLVDLRSQLWRSGSSTGWLSRLAPEQAAVWAIMASQAEEGQYLDTVKEWHDGIVEQSSPITYSFGDKRDHDVRYQMVLGVRRTIGQHQADTFLEPCLTLYIHTPSGPIYRIEDLDLGKVEYRNRYGEWRAAAKDWQKSLPFDIDPQALYHQPFWLKS